MDQPGTERGWEAQSTASGTEFVSDDAYTDSGSAGKSSSEAIQVFCRIRPTKSPARNLCLVDKSSSRIQLQLPKDDSAGYVNNQREAHEFQFNGIFDTSATQTEVFDTLARPLVNNFLAGINGTIFAYGQTGSGKTFSITGGTDSYEQRGIIPRTLAMVFEETAKRKHEYMYAIFVSYLEIYNDNGYDLLDPSHDTKKLEDLPKVILNQDEYGNVHLKNLNETACGTIDEALNLLFVGDTNRMICETPSNDASSRSHCVFTITLEARQKGGSKVRRSKLHLVDLAGSERVKKTDVKGKILTEARYINLSLHYLEQVIVMLNQKAMRGDKAVIHVPYRNSMLTSVLRDSLGGNCKTAMLATMSLERNHLDESLSTARFAQRVAAVRNTAEVNESTDPVLQVQQLRAQLSEIKEQLAVARGSMAPPQPLTDDDISRCQLLVTRFLENEQMDTKDEGKSEGFYQYGGIMKSVLGNPTKAGFCFELIRLSYRKLLGSGGRSRDKNGNNGGGGGASSDSARPASSGLMDQQALIEQLEINIQQLRKEIQARENEINILVGLLKGSSSAAAALSAEQAASLMAKIKAGGPASESNSGMSGAQAAILAALERGQALPSNELLQASGERLQKLKQQKGSEATEEEKQELVDRSVAFESFRNAYPDRDKIEENKETLKQRINVAKGLGESINADRSEIAKIKERVERLRIARAAQHVAETESGDRAFDPEAVATEMTEEEKQLLNEMEHRKARYQKHYMELRELRKEIETLQHMLERQRHKLQSEFEKWFEQEQKIAAAALQRQNGGSSTHSGRTVTSSQDTLVSAQSSTRRAPLNAAPDLMSRFGLSTSPTSMSSRTTSLPTPGSSSTTSSTTPSSASAHIPSVGNAQVDADIAAFYRLRDQVLNSSSGGSR